MGYVQRAADVAHKGALLGLASVFGFQLYQLTTKAWGGLDKENPRSPTFSDNNPRNMSMKFEKRQKMIIKTIGRRIIETGMIKKMIRI